MNKLILFLLFFSLISCRKNEDKLYPENLADKPIHCYNHKYDSMLGELSFDCGGPCNTCSFVTAVCTSKVNTFQHSVLNGNFTLFKIDTIKSYIPYLLIRASEYNIFKVKIAVNDTINILNKEYSTTDKRNKNNVTLNLEYNNKSYYSESGKMFINFINDSLRINLCDVKLETKGGEKSEIDNANITFKP